MTATIAPLALVDLSRVDWAVVVGGGIVAAAILAGILTVLRGRLPRAPRPGTDARQRHAEALEDPAAEFDDPGIPMSDLLCVCNVEACFCPALVKVPTSFLEAGGTANVPCVQCRAGWHVLTGPGGPRTRVGRTDR